MNVRWGRSRDNTSSIVMWRPPRFSQTQATHSHTPRSSVLGHECERINSAFVEISSPCSCLNKGNPYLMKQSVRGTVREWRADICKWENWITVTHFIQCDAAAAAELRSFRTLWMPQSSQSASRVALPQLNTIHNRKIPQYASKWRFKNAIRNRDVLWFFLEKRPSSGHPLLHSASEWEELQLH